MNKKIITIILAVALILSLAACGGQNVTYPYGPVEGGANASDAVSGNGNYVVQKGDYLYFINTSETVYTENKLGESNKGAIIRSDLEGKNQTVVFPKVVSNKSGTGLYIIEDTIYFTSPCDAIDSSGNVQTSLLDIMSVKIDGTEAKKIATLKDNTTKLYFVKGEDSKAVYAVYEGVNEDGEKVLYRINTSSNDAKKEAFLKDYTSILFNENYILYTKTALISEETKIPDNYSNVIVNKIDGEVYVDGTTVFNGKTSSDSIKYMITLIEESNGKLYFSKKDSVLTLEDSLNRCDFSFNSMSDFNCNNSERVGMFSATANSIVEYNYNDKTGVIISKSGIGTAFYNNDKTLTRLKASTLMIQNAAENYLFIFEGEDKSEKGIKAYDVDKVLTDEEISEAPSEEILGEDKAVISTFGTVVVLNGKLYFYSKDNANKLTAYDINSKTVSVIGID